MGAREWAILIVLSVLWGGSFFFNAIAVHDLPSLTLVWLRVTVAAAALSVTVRVAGAPMPRDGRTWLALFGVALLNNVLPFALIAWGQHRIASALAAILNATTPLFTVLAAHVFTSDERLTAPRSAGVLVGFAGAATVIGPDALAEIGTTVLAQLACLAAALSYACAGVFGRRFKRMGAAPLGTAAGQVCASSLLLLPLVLSVDRPWTLPVPHATTWGAIAGLGLLSTALAYWLYFRLLATAGATNLLLVTFLIPVSASLLGALLLGEALLARHLLGMALIGAGLALIDGRPLQTAHRWRQKMRAARQSPDAVGRHAADATLPPGADCAMDADGKRP
jgi:drug/metabolite transporter (DMT)-like permease